MTLRSFLIQLVAIVLLLQSAPRVDAVEAQVHGLSRALEACPDDVLMFVHLNDASHMRTQIAGRPIATALTRFFADGQFGDEWARLAQALGQDEAALFDAVLGRQCTLMQRGKALQDGTIRLEWVMITEMPSQQQDAILRTLRARVQSPSYGYAVRSIPEHGMLAASSKDILFLGPTAESELFHDVLRRWGGKARGDAPTMASHEAARHFEKLGRGQAAVFVKHGASLGGWSTAVFGLDRSSLKIRHAARFDRPPFSRPVTRQATDISVVQEFEELALASFIEPSDIGVSLFESFASQSMNIELANSAMHANTGRRRMTIIGEEEGRLREPSEDLLSPTVAICIEARSTDQASKDLDRHMTQLATQFNRMGGGNFEIQVPPVHDFMSGRRARRIDLSPMTDAVGGGMPIFNNVSLNWTVVRGDFGSWYVISTHPDHLGDVLDVLATSERSIEPVAGQFDSAGSLNGVRLAQHLTSWKSEAPRLAKPDKIDEFRGGLTMLAEFAAGMDIFRWRLTRPTRSTMALDIEIDLADGASLGNR